VRVMNDIKNVLSECLGRIGLDENWVLSIVARACVWGGISNDKFL
jgi:hypothetical protein